MPAQLRPLAWRYPEAIYDAMFRSVAATLLEIGASRLGATLGLTLVLHTWTRRLTYHVHLHGLATAGGLPLGFKKIRHAGLYGRPAALAQAKGLLAGRARGS